MIHLSQGVEVIASLCSFVSLIVCTSYGADAEIDFANVYPPQLTLLLRTHTSTMGLPVIADHFFKEGWPLCGVRVVVYNCFVVCCFQLLVILFPHLQLPLNTIL